MKKIILFLITITTFTNVSYASFPVVEKVSNQTTGSNGPILYMPVITLIIWTIVVFTLLGFLGVLLKKKQRTGGSWPLYLLALGLGVVGGILMIILMWRGLGCIIGFC